jgi:hypothetical protein
MCGDMATTNDKSAGRNRLVSSVLRLFLSLLDSWQLQISVVFHDACNKMKTSIYA